MRSNPATHHNKAAHFLNGHLIRAKVTPRKRSFRPVPEIRAASRLGNAGGPDDARDGDAVALDELPAEGADVAHRPRVIDELLEPPQGLGLRAQGARTRVGQSRGFFRKKPD